ncbi:YkgJ family cysteine cluster protein [Paludibacterium sp. B53371]|nr:YkgJ family cysteine cluster protein [Paludibacterium sp. B53371]
MTEDRILNTAPSDNPCTTCGACCAHFRVSFYCGELTGGSGGIVPAELASQLNPVMACMKGTETGNGRCIALRGTLGSPDIRCSIYPQRPSPCRAFNSWLDDGQPNPDCQRLRAGIGLPPLTPRTVAEPQLLSD